MDRIKNNVKYRKEITMRTIHELSNNHRNLVLE